MLLDLLMLHLTELMIAHSPLKFCMGVAKNSVEQNPIETLNQGWFKSEDTYSLQINYCKLLLIYQYTIMIMVRKFEEKFPKFPKPILKVKAGDF